jgi:hypothetical protein
MVKKARKPRPYKGPVVEQPEIDESEDLEESEEELEDSEEELEESAPVASFGRRRPQPSKKFFTALLMEGLTYEIYGMKFRRGVPQQVPYKYISKFKTNGWFQLSNL